MTRSKRTCSLVCAAAIALAGCGVESAAPEADAAAAARAAIASGQGLVGWLAYGETSAPVSTSGFIRFRAFLFEGEAGDQVTVDVRSTNGGDAQAWLIGPDFEVLAYNDDGADGSPDAHLELALTDSGVHLILLRDAQFRRRTFTVELQGGPPDSSSLAIGFTWSDSRLVTFDPVAGVVEEVHLQMGHEAFIGMTYDPNHHLLYAVAQLSFNLYAIDVATMRASHLGNLRIDARSSWAEDVQALAYDPIHDVLYGTVVRWESSDDRATWRTDLVRIDVTTAAVATVGTIPQVFVTAMDFNADDGQLYGVAEGVDGKNRIVRIDPDDATSVELLLTPYDTMLGFARMPDTGTYVSWINDATHFYGEIDLEAGTITPLANSDAVNVIAAFVHRSFEAASVPVPRPEIPASFRFTGHVVGVQDPDGRLGGSIAPGDSITGRIAYDVNAPYRWDPVASTSYGISATIGDGTFAIDTLEAYMANNAYDDWARTLTDSIGLDADREWSPGFPVPMNIERISWSLADSTAQALSNNDALPLAYELSAWSRNALTIQGLTEEWSDEGYTISAVVDTIVPE